MSDGNDLRNATDLPNWIQTFKASYLQTTLAQYILHGNVHDWVLINGERISMVNFFDRFFEPGGKLIVHYDPSRGIYFPNDMHAARAGTIWLNAGFLNELGTKNRPSDHQMAQHVRHQLGTERDPAIALEALEVLLTSEQAQVALVIHYAELVAPAGAGQLNFADRTASARLHRWSLSEDIAAKNNIIFMLVDSLPSLSSRIARNPRLLSIKIPLPDHALRQKCLLSLKVNERTKSSQLLARASAGLQLRQIEDIVRGTRARDDQGHFRLSVDELIERKKHILEQECHGLIEVVQPDHNFKHVGGMTHIKGTLMRIAEHVRAGRKTQVPMGILCVGPMGTGKSFLAEAFANESGLSTVKLKNFRDRWVGSTEANLEKVLDVIEALGEILVIIDEGDRSIGGAGDSDGGVNSRVIARLKEFMSDTTHRGRIIFMMMTNRPDKLDTDLKRPGRFDLKIPFFVPQTAHERALIMKAVIRRNQIPCDLTENELARVLDEAEGYSAAELEAVTLLAFDDMQSESSTSERVNKVTEAHLVSALLDFMPTRETEMIAYMEYLAVSEASNRRLLPERFKEITVSELQRALGVAREQLMRANARAL